jgi:hypothetical protein
VIIRLVRSDKLQQNKFILLKIKEYVDTLFSIALFSILHIKLVDEITF